jgi:hypothetical protein
MNGASRGLHHHSVSGKTSKPRMSVNLVKVDVGRRGVRWFMNVDTLVGGYTIQNSRESAARLDTKKKNLP